MTLEEFCGVFDIETFYIYHNSKFVDKISAKWVLKSTYRYYKVVKATRSEVGIKVEVETNK